MFPLLFLYLPHDAVAPVAAGGNHSMPRNLDSERFAQTGMQAAWYRIQAGGLASTERNQWAGSCERIGGEAEWKQGSGSGTRKIHMDRCGTQPNIPLHLNQIGI